MVNDIWIFGLILTCCPVFLGFLENVNGTSLQFYQLPAKSVR